MLKKFSLLGLILGLVITLPSIAADKVYKWVDDQGVTHYDSSPPRNQNVTVITPKTGHSEPVVYKKSASAIAAEKAIMDAKANIPEERLTLKDPARCTAAKNNVKKLENFGRVRVQEEDGGFHYLTEDEQKSKIKAAQKAISESC